MTWRKGVIQTSRYLMILALMGEKGYVSAHLIAKGRTPT